MADRKASVALELKAGQFKAEATEAEGKVDGLDRKVDKLDRSITKIPPDAAKAAAAMKLLGDESGKAGVKLDDLGKRSTSMGAIDERIAKTRAEVRGLAEDFNRTGDAGFLAKLIGGQKDLQELEKLKKRISGALSDGAAEGGREGGKVFTSELSGMLSTPGLGPIVTAVLVSAAIAAAPLIGAALMGAAGIGGVAAGVVGQLHDPQVHKAFVDVGHDLSTTLTNDTQGFKQPLISGARELQGALHQVLDTVDWKAAADDVAPLVRGLTRLGIDIIPGINKLLGVSGPILQALVGDLAGLATGISTAFSEMAAGGKGAQETLRLVVGAIASALVVVGALVLGVSKLVEWFIAAGSHVGDFISKLDTSFPLVNRFGQGLKAAFDQFNGANDVHTLGRAVNNLGTATAPTAEGLAKMAAALNETKLSAASLEAAMAGKLFSTILNVDQGILGWHKSLLDLHDTLDQNGLAIDRHTGLVSMNTKAGIGNREAVLAAMTANMQQYQAFIAAGGAADVATKNYDDNTAALEAMLHKANYTQKQIDDMIGSLKSVPHKTQADIAMNGLAEAINNMGNLLAELNHLNGRDYGFTVTERHVYESDYLTHQQGEHNRWGGIYQHAAAGLLRDANVYSATSPGRYMIAEPATGGEAFVPRRGDYGRSTAILDQAARWYGGRFAPGGAGGGGGGGPMVYLTVNAGLGTDGRAVGQQIADVLRPWVASNGGNVQRALAGRTVN